MDVAEPASAALAPGSASVLRALAGAEAPMTIRQLARVSAVSSNRAQQVVARLVEHGVVIAEDYGRARLCRLNRDHLASGPLVALASLRSAFLTLLRDEIQAWPLQADHASLFGSAARGDGGTDSDLDVLIVLPKGISEDDQRWRAQLVATHERVHRSTGNAIAWFIQSDDEIANAVDAGEPILDEWRVDSVWLAGRSLATLLRGVP